MPRQLYHVHVEYVAVFDDYEDQILQEASGYTHASSLKQAAYNVARQYRITTKNFYGKNFDQLFRFYELDIPEPNNTSKSQPKDPKIEYISIFDDLEDCDLDYAKPSGSKK